MKVTVVALSTAMAVWAALSAMAEDRPAPDTSKIVALSGRMSMAQACPVAPWLAISNDHVFDLRPFDNFPLIPYRGQSDVWMGVVRGIMTSWEADIAFGVPTTDFPSWYEIATEGPQPGERLWWVGYDWRNGSRGFGRRVFSGEVTRTVAGSIFIEAEAFPGSSGSCVLNADGRVVGILTGVATMDNANAVTVVVGIWPPWLKLPKEEDIRAAVAGR